MRRIGAFARLTSISRNDPSSDGRTPSWYRLRFADAIRHGLVEHGRQTGRSSEQALVPGVTGRTRTSDQIGDATLDTPEVRQTQPERRERHRARPEPIGVQVNGRPRSEDSESVDHADERIQIEQPPPLRWNEADRVDHGRREHPQLQEKRDDVPDVAIDARTARRAPSRRRPREERQQQQRRQARRAAT